MSLHPATMLFSTPRISSLLAAALFAAALAGCDSSPYAPEADDGIQFKDSLSANVDPGDALGRVTFVESDGKEVDVPSLAKGRSVVLVVTRGFTGAVCPYCSTQVAQLIANYPKFVERNAEVIVVYPVSEAKDSDALETFLTKTRARLKDPSTAVPFPVLLDVELKAVDLLGIRKDLSKPATYILDSRGAVRFAYVGESLSDRPSIKALLEQLDPARTSG